MSATGSASSEAFWPIFSSKTSSSLCPINNFSAFLARRGIEDAARTPTFAEALEVGYKAFGQVACTEAAKEGIAAFLEKRSPAFRK